MFSYVLLYYILSDVSYGMHNDWRDEDCSITIIIIIIIIIVIIIVITTFIMYNDQWIQNK
jgi:heme/copper-type cytochrome/quinol oxidase subunit 4